MEGHQTAVMATRKAVSTIIWNSQVGDECHTNFSPPGILMEGDADQNRLGRDK